MRKLLASILILVPAAALAAAPAPPASQAAPAVSVTVPAVSVTVPAVKVTVNVPEITVNVPATTVKVPAASGPAQVMTTRVPAAGLDELDLTVRAGALQITSGATDSVRVKVRVAHGGEGHFIFTWTTGSGNGGAPANLHLVAHRAGHTLSLCLATDTCEGANADAQDMGGWNAQWQIVVPKRFHVAVNGGALDAHVQGVGGGLDINIGFGKLSTYLPNGPVTAKVGMGKLDVAVASPEYGPVHLATGVGDASFTVAGRKITAGFKRAIVSSSQNTTGNGKVAYDLKAGTGSITLALGTRQGPSGGSDPNE